MAEPGLTTAIRSLIHFRVKPGREAEFESAFEDSGMLTRPMQVDGFLGAELLRSHSTPTDYYVVGRWSSAEAYADWQRISLGDADRTDRNRLLETLIDPSPGRLFDAVASSTNEV